MHDTINYAEALRILENSFELYVWSENLTAFEVLISTILSQKTERKNKETAFLALKQRIGVTPERLAAAQVMDIADAIRPAGLFRSKAPKIQEVAQIVLERYDGDLSVVLKMSMNHARKELMRLPGVGLKTADILLSFVANRPVFAVDVHIERIGKRRGLAPQAARYEEIRAAYEAEISPDERVRTHKALIEFGREICTARNPNHDICPVSDYCMYNRKLDDPKVGDQTSVSSSGVMVVTIVLNTFICVLQSSKRILNCY
ncbi:MAG TPA: endonuclease III [Candidatus Aquicultor sp.]|jgi:endonuclease-3